MTGYPAIGAVGTDSLAYNPYLYSDSLGYANLSQYNTDSIPYSNPVMGTTSPSFQGLSSDSLNASYNYANTSTEKKGGVNPWVVTAGVTLLTVGAACYLRGRGVNANGSFLEKLKAGGEANWKSITNFFKGGEKAAAEAVEGAGKKAASSAPRNVANLVNGAQEYTIVKDGITIVMKGNKPVQITTKGKNVITDKTAIDEWLNKNVDLKNKINGLTIQKGQRLPNNISLRYTRTFGDHTYVVENNKIVEVIGKAKNGSQHPIKGEELTKFLEKHSGEATKATSLEVILTGKKVGKIAKGSDKITVTVNNGKIISAKNGSKELTTQEINELQKVYKLKTSQIGYQTGNTYNNLGTAYEYVYTYKGNKYILDSNGKVKEITESIQNKTIDSTKGIEKYLEKNSELKGQLDSIASSGTLPEGARFGNIVVKTEDGLLCTIGSNGHKLESVTLANGTKFEGDALKTWRETAENENSISKILEMLK